MQRPYFIIKKQELQKFLKSKKPKACAGPQAVGLPTVSSFPRFLLFLSQPFWSATEGLAAQFRSEGRGLGSKPAILGLGAGFLKPLDSQVSKDLAPFGV